MLIGIPQATATLLTILVFYALDFTLINRYDKQRQASGTGTGWLNENLVNALGLAQ